MQLWLPTWTYGKQTPNVVQRIVYDDEETWIAEDPSLPSVGTPVVQFSRAREVLKRVTA
jgi:hypothetical protein